MSTIDNQNRFKSTVFHALSDPIRLEIIAYLRDGEKCVCEIVPHLNLIQPLVSRHLKILKDAGIIRCRKDGTKRMYSIVDQRIFEVVDALSGELVNTLTKEAFENAFC
ncbi:MAG: metalloregulator ArsR/SmtB family transcription factor [Candidatus Bathyarchaeota archaeon]|nr:metalloregulator ArsR/SmtB family transcription factor [Candidatus Bathyarchaeota archaeon]